MSITESCIAAAIVSAVMAVTLPSMNRARKVYTLRAAAHEVASKMHAARIAAIVRNRDCRMRVTSPVSYVIECEDVPWQVIDSVTVSEGVTVQANTSPLFRRRGNVVPTATFTLRNAAGTARVIVNVNGRVRLQ